MKKQITILAWILLFGWGTPADASGVSVSPGEVNIKTERGRAKTEIIRIKNPTASVSLVNVYPDEMEEVVRAIPSSFILEGGAEREIAIEARPKKEGVAAGTLSVRAEALSKEALGGAAGVKIPLRLEVAKASPYFANIALAVSKGGGWILLFIALLCVGFALFWKSIQEFKKTP